MGSPMGWPTDSQKELLADCTCPVCQEVFVSPQRLKCSHTLCRKCVHKMSKKASSEEQPDPELFPLGLFSMFGAMGEAHKAMSSGGSSKKKLLRCPICREEGDRCEPDETAEALVRVLRLLRTARNRCAAEDCWAESSVSCACCDKSYCQRHYDAQLAAVRASGDALCQGLRALLLRDDAATAEQLLRLQAAEDATAELQDALAETVQRGLAEFRRQVQRSRAQLEAPMLNDAADAEARAALQCDLGAAVQLLAQSGGGDLRGLARLLPAASQRLKAAESKHPPRLLALQFQPSELIADLASVMRRVSAATYQSPYTQLPPVLSRVHARGLTQKPWDICILSNLEGIVCIDDVLKLASSSGPAGQPMSGPLLVINVQCFPTKMLHVTDMDVRQVATISPKFGAEGMPGRIHIYNERQLILASDAGRHMVFVFNLEGQLLTSFGEKGDGPRQFHAPLGISANNGQMFVTDSKNKRIQVFDMDDSYSCVATIQHDGFSNGIHSVSANASSVFVVDRNQSLLFVFDRETRASVNSKLTLDGKPFDVVPDEFGNAFVTLADESKVQIVHRHGSLRTIGFKDTHHNQQQPDPEHMMLSLMTMSTSPPRMFHGAAYEPTKRRLFIADLMRSCIIVADL